MISAGLVSGCGVISKVGATVEWVDSAAGYVGGSVTSGSSFLCLWAAAEIVIVDGFLT